MQNVPLNDEALEHLVNNLNFLKDVLPCKVRKDRTISFNLYFNLHFNLFFNLYLLKDVDH